MDLGGAHGWRACVVVFAILVRAMRVIAVVVWWRGEFAIGSTVGVAIHSIRWKDG